MRRWLMVTAMAVLAAVPATGFAQTPSGDKMKDDKMKMEQGAKMKDDKMKGQMKDDKMMKDKMMDKKDDKMEKMDKK
ncbi:MAG TPA: hypothetical protein VL086_01870 [Candidatus Nitrosotalea sp.]|jgi:hypothetical protein|nr:hypothetical protein [Candidatus Nitrosotalea sp.]